MGVSKSYLYDPECEWPNGRHVFPDPRFWTGYASDFECIYCHCTEEELEL